MKSEQKSTKSSASLTNKELKQNGRVIAHALEEQKVVIQKNMAKAEKRQATMLENAAKIALSGGVLDGFRNN